MAKDSFFEDSSRKRKRGGVGNKGNTQLDHRRPSTSSGGGVRGGGSSSSSDRGRSNGGFARKGKGRQRDDDGDDHDHDQKSLSRMAARVGRGMDEELGGSDSGSDEEGYSSDDGGDNLQEDLDFDSEEEEAQKETAAQKRLRLAKGYLEALKASQETAGIDAAQLERDIIAERLQKDVLEVSGKLHLRIADRYTSASPRRHFTSNKVHRQSLTCAVATEDCRYLFTTSKDGSIARWDITSAVVSSSAPITASSSSSSDPSTSLFQQPLIVKTDFIPKRPALNKGKGRGKQLRQDAKGKATIARNQPSQDLSTHGHTDEIYSLSISSDGKRLASGGKDRRIGVWDISGPSSSSSSARSQGCKWVAGLKGHKDTISAVVFRQGTQQIYSASFDRTLKIYDAAALSYVETLFGHQDKIYDLSLAGRNEVAVSTGGRDKTLRYWKIKDESQLVFRAGGISKVRKVLEGGMDDDEDDEAAVDKKNKNNKSAVTLTPNGDAMAAVNDRKFVEGSVDCTAMVDDQHFLSGGDSGTISLWSTTKKKAIFNFPLAHGVQEYHSETEGIVHNPRWIVSLACLPYSDLFASGSWDGQIRLWKISTDIRSFTPLATIDALGIVNSLQLLQVPASTRQVGMTNGTSQKTKTKSIASKEDNSVLVVAALAQEHKFGRWQRVDKAKNVAMLALLDPSSSL